MFSLNRFARLFTFSVSFALGTQAPVLLAQASSTSQPPQAPAAQQAPATQGPLTVQARLKARREQRRAAAIHDVYSHLYEVYVGTGYMRFTPGEGATPGEGLQKVNEWSWNVGATRYYNERLGVTVDARGIYGSAYIGPNPYSNTAVYKPAISQYTGMIGPTYRFLIAPKYSVSGRIMAGAGYGNFSGDLGSFTPAGLGLYSDGITAAVSASVPVELNLTPTIGFRIAPEYVLTSFGSTIQNNLGYTLGLVYRWGRQ